MDGGHSLIQSRIGPNAILQLVPVLDRAIGAARRAALFDTVSVPMPSPDAGMLDQDQVIRLYRAVGQTLSDLAPGVMRAAGLATADYILANRIPSAAKVLIRALPGTFGARVLAQAIARHAWTFAGSGQFRIKSYHPLILTIADNPLATGTTRIPSCHWHSAVFERLFATLVWPGVQVTELACCAAGDNSCHFRITPQLCA
jgi:divinyl protochlorophyllide a 8-vinyl-reductase